MWVMGMNCETCLSMARWDGRRVPSLREGIAQEDASTEEAPRCAPGPPHCRARGTVKSATVPRIGRGNGGEGEIGCEGLRDACPFFNLTRMRAFMYRISVPFSADP